MDEQRRRGAAVGHQVDQIFQQNDAAFGDIRRRKVLFTLDGREALARALCPMPRHSLHGFFVVHLHGRDIHALFRWKRADQLLRPCGFAAAAAARDQHNHALPSCGS